MCPYGANQYNVKNVHAAVMRACKPVPVDVWFVDGCMVGTCCCKKNPVDGQQKQHILNAQYTCACRLSYLSLMEPMVCLFISVFAIMETKTAELVDLRIIVGHTSQ